MKTGNILATVFCAALVLGLAPRAVAQTTDLPGCGYLNGPVCTPFDNEAWNIYFSLPVSCDFGLIGDYKFTCVNSSRQTLTQSPSWVAWAMGEQRYDIGGNVPLNYITTFGTHNSFSSYGDGFQSALTTDQKLSITDQLQAGARYIRLDPDYWYNNMRLCHGSSTALCALLSPPAGLVLGGYALAELGPIAPFVGTVEGVITPGRLYAYAVKEVADWMEKNPAEFLILDIHAGRPQDTTICCRTRW